MANENQKCVGVVFSDRAYKDIQTETYDKDPVETGGILLGHVLSTGHWVVVEVIPPGDNSTHQYAYFEYDEHFVNRVADPVANKYEQKLELLGLWHRHPGSMDFFSGTDDGTNIKFAEINPDYGAISGLVNIDPEFRMTMYHVDSPLNYTKVETFVGDDIIPAELLKLKEGVTFEDIDAIKKPKIRSEQQPAAPQQQTQQTRQTTPNREEPRRTAPNREHHEKPQVIIQSPDTVTSIFKKLVLEHTKAVLIASIVIVISIAGVLVNSSSQKTKRKEIASVEKQKLEEKKEAEKRAHDKEAEKEKIIMLYDNYINENERSSTTLENYLKQFRTLEPKLIYEENKALAKEKIKEIQSEFDTAKDRETTEKNNKAEAALRAEEQRKATAEYNKKIKHTNDAFNKDVKLKNCTLDNLNNYLTTLDDLLLTNALQYPDNKTAAKNLSERIKTKKEELELQKQQQEDAEKEKEKDINKEYNDAINIPCNKTIEALEQCIEKLKGLHLVYHENDKLRNEKVKELKRQKQELLKNKQEDEDKTLLENNEAYNYFKEARIDSKNHEKHLGSLKSIQDKIQSPKYKTEVEQLINKNDPEKLKKTLQEVTNAQNCDKQCNAYGIYKITADEKDEVRKKFEETCQGKCGIKKSK